MKAITLRLPDELYEHLRTRSFHERRSMNDLVLNAIHNDKEPNAQR